MAFVSIKTGTFTLLIHSHILCASVHFGIVCYLKENIWHRNMWNKVASLLSAWGIGQTLSNGGGGG